jgi:hypothetical protein
MTLADTAAVDEDVATTSTDERPRNPSERLSTTSGSAGRLGNGRAADPDS